MTEPDNLKELEDDGAYKPPFLRITATYPTVAGNPETVTVEMNLDDGAPMAGEVDPADGSIKSWFTQFCTQVIISMRRSAAPPVVVTMTGSGIKKFFSDRTQHAPDCDGSCEEQPSPVKADIAADPREANGEPVPAREHVGGSTVDAKGGE